MAEDLSLEEILEGKLRLYSEDGVAGSYWAFQDSRYISANTTRYRCERCNLFWDKEEHPSAPPRFPRRGGYSPCSSEDHNFELVSEETWDPQGLHFLKDGDELTIYHPKVNRIIWSGVIDLGEGVPQGIDKKTWAEYFFKRYPARLRAYPSR